MIYDDEYSIKCILKNDLKKNIEKKVGILKNDEISKTILGKIYFDINPKNIDKKDIIYTNIEKKIIITI